MVEGLGFEPQTFSTWRRDHNSRWLHRLAVSLDKLDAEVGFEPHKFSTRQLDYESSKFHQFLHSAIKWRKEQDSNAACLAQGGGAQFHATADITN